MKLWIRRIIDFLNETKNEHLGAFAGQSAFFIFLSIFPLLNIILMLTPFLPYSKEELVETIVRIIPEDLAGFAKSLIEDIFSNGTPTLTIVAIVTGLWSASKGVMAIRNGLDEVCRAGKKMNFFVDRAISALYTAVFLIMLFALAFVNLFGTQLAEYVVENHADLAYLVTFLLRIRVVVTMLLTFLVILLMYTILPSKKLLMKYQVVGAAICAVGWELLSWGFSYYIRYTTKQSYMYGSLATIITLLLWLYIVVNIILWCAQINQFLYLHVFKEKADPILERKLAKRTARRARAKAWAMDKLPVMKKKEEVKEEAEEKDKAEEKEEQKEG